VDALGIFMWWAEATNLCTLRGVKKIGESGDKKGET
jgi:hypothetical protein